MTCTAHRARRPPNELIGRMSRAVPLPHAPLERGSVTAEFATVLPAVMVVALLLLSLARLVGVSIGCQDAASAAARAAVAAGGGADASAAARNAVGDGIALNVSTAGQRVNVVARCPVLPDPRGVLPTVVEGRAVGILT